MKVDSRAHRVIAILRKLAVSVCLPANRWLSLSLIARKRCVSQAGQDLFALAYYPKRRGGFFVEFGAADGKKFSNTYMLEKDFAWTGILAEPVKEFHEMLHRQRTCAISKNAVWANSTDSLTINVCKNMLFSSIAGATQSSVDPENSRVVSSYAVPCISLNDLLEANGAPAIIDYLSIDVEGSELRVLEAFDFSRYLIRVITVEHNYSTDRKAINELLSKQGFRQKLAWLSRWDDWYVHSTVDACF